jgi:hypothetical protein
MDLEDGLLEWPNYLVQLKYVTASFVAIILATPDYLYWHFLG